MTMTTVEEARGLAVLAHGDQQYGSEPYVKHLDDVAALCEPFGTKAQIVAYLHDTVEDTSLAPQTIEEHFGREIRELVEALTDPPGKNRKERKAGSYARLGAITASSPNALALIVKAADRLANVRACVASGNARLLEMYRSEQPTFDLAVHRPGLNDALMNELAALLPGS